MVSDTVTCQCGFKFPLPHHINLKDFETIIISSSEFHNISCDAVPIFQVKEHGGVFQFLASCESCQMINLIFETQGGACFMDDTN